ncbi:hypothetical protein M514_25637 [Trichuris suis]|uniref:Uncharacterized protein n=1 Tax=Trichuris suis TaxID=68888 RepID=A0A085MY56_9BILA|nr:hypothetical protein M514_25637 [Trichuris suis]
MTFNAVLKFHVVFLTETVNDSKLRRNLLSLTTEHVGLQKLRGTVCWVTVDRLTIAEVDVSVCPPLKRRVIPLCFVLMDTCARQCVCVHELQSLVHCLHTGVTEVVVRSWRIESRNRIDSSRRRIPFATVAGDGSYNEELDLRWSVIACTG